jgi:predicted protein tyrosine phosphatase
VPTLYVCPLSRLDETLRGSGARTVVTLLRPGGATTPLLRDIRHLHLDVSDIAEPLDGHVMPGTAHVDTLLRFAADWDGAAPLLIHCYAGVSRSTAAAFVLACALQPEADEATLACALRSASPTATPNPRIVALADAMLDRRDRMIAAVAAIGRGAECFEGEPFRLELGQMPAYQS